jgi:hypothetical protein
MTMAYKQSESKNDFYNVLHNLNILAKSVQFDPIFEPTLEETKQLDDITLRIMELITVTEYNK